MNARPRDGVVAIVIAVVLLAGVALDTWGPKVSARQTVAAVEPGFTARAVFCPPSLGRPASRATVTVAARGEEPLDVGFEPASDQRVQLPGRTMLVHKPSSAGAEDVVGYGGRLDASVVTSIAEPVSGVGAAGCAPSASTRWYFPEGNSTVTHDERLLIYNPFPDEAVVNVDLLTTGGQVVKAGLADKAVPSEGSLLLRLEKYVLEQKVLGVVVSAVRGRVVSWRLSIAEPEEKPSGVQFTLGSVTPADVWYFPEGAVGTGFEERLSILNPGDEEATVDVTLVTATRSVPAAGGTDVAIPPRSTIAVVLDEASLAGESGGAAAIVESVNGVPIVAERTVFYASQEVDGVASEIGAPAPSQRWLLGPATSHPATDSAVLLNPGGEEGRVSLTLLRPDGQPLEPPSLANLKIGARSRLRVPLSEVTRGAAYAVLVDATVPVVAERFSYSGGAGDVASLMGIPLDEEG